MQGFIPLANIFSELSFRISFDWQENQVQEQKSNDIKDLEHTYSS